MKILKVSIILTAFALVLWNCDKSKNDEQAQDNSIVIEGEVAEPQGEEVILEKIENNQLIGFDTAQLDEKNKFKFTLNIDKPDFYRINIGGVQKRILILNKDDLHIVAGGAGMNDMFEVTGSLEMDQIQDVDSIVESINQELMALNKEYVQAQNEGNQEKAQQLISQFETSRDQQQAVLKEYIKGMEPSLAVISALSFIQMDNNVDFIESVLQKVDTLYPDSEHVQAYKEELANAKKLAIGQPAPNIMLPTPEGDTVELESLRGKYVLIDFWAAWCAPCRQENPNVVKMYNQYRDKGFEIYGVSLDRSKDAWVKAIEADGLEWIHVSDLAYFDSRAAAKYNVDAIPFTVLIDKEGNIIAKNLRGKKLEEKLKELLG